MRKKQPRPLSTQGHDEKRVGIGDPTRAPFVFAHGLVLADAKHIPVFSLSVCSRARALAVGVTLKRRVMLF
jgi:hypothetical protein